ncbi:nucleoside diphosphate-linked moiety X motif 8 [Ceratina calcarata]|uniref:Nucleoside diphosphate-linked moiety X motif 8 n=1 Tax=Ceratina calcarata TaxID=156304 RepID=A0AAJ7IYV6_9HYME|nr:nucleoside diphosphate-linked moiety X motif 8 [Ceratina calcarata]
MSLHPLTLRYLQRCFSSQPQRGLSAVHLELLKPEVVLSEKNRKSFVEKFKSPKTTQIQENVSHASVLVPLCMHQGELGFLYTLRSTKINSNRGQVSFPGGMYDKEDRNLEETALRETWEELKIPRTKIDVWAAGNMIDKQKIKVLPVFGYIGEINPEKLNVNKEEVGEAFFVSLRKLCDPSLCRYTQFRDGYSLPVYLGGKYRVWGFTGAITHIVLNVLVPDVYNQQLVYLRNVTPEKEISISR